MGDIFLRLTVVLIIVFLGSLAISCIGQSRPAVDMNPTDNSDPMDNNHSSPRATPSKLSDGSITDPSEDEYGKILVLANRGDPPAGFDTLRTSSIALHHVAGALYGPGNLVMRCRENMYLVCQYLASNWISNPGFTEWTFTIREDVYWHDGIPFTAEDAKFWFDLAYNATKTQNKIRAPAYFKGELGDIENVSVLDHNRLRITFTHPAPYFLDILANPRFKIAHPRHLMEPRIKLGEVSISPLDIGLVGLGPFEIERYEKGNVVHLRRFPGYWETGPKGTALPYLDGIDYVIMPEPFSMDVAFRTGRLDGGARGQAHHLTAERKEGYVRDLGEKVFFAEIDGGTFRLAFNVLKPGPWQDPQVRRAIGLWIDKQSAIPSALGGFGWTAPDLGPPNRLIPRHFLNWPKFDLGSLQEKRAEAKRLLLNAGYEDGFSMGHLCRAVSSTPCEFLKGQLSGLNIDLQLQMVDEGQWNRARISLDYDTQQGRLAPSPIPEGTESVYGRYSNNPDAYAKHEDPEIDDLYRRLRDALTLSHRIELWREIEKYLYTEQTYIIPIAESVNVVPYRTYVQGLVIPPEDKHTHTDFSTVWLGTKEGSK
jgi:ABC-type transport system substrate-binding protein